MKVSDPQYSALKSTPSVPRINPRLHASPVEMPHLKFQPASRAERMASWNRRMQSLFTRQTY